MRLESFTRRVCSKMNMKFEIVTLSFLLTALLRNVNCELSPDAVANLLQIYSMNVNSSLSLSRSDRELLSSWSEEFQIKRVNVTTKFRLQMVKHKEHSFRRRNLDKKWIICMDVYTKEIVGSQRMYFENESGCLKVVNADDTEKRKAVDQVEKEIKKWRKSYKYLLHLCSISNPDDDTNAGVCLVDYIERDGYNSTLQRLMLMKLEAMGELYLTLTNSMTNLEECLKMNLSSYLDSVRSVMEKLNRCYGGIQKE